VIQGLSLTLYYHLIQDRPGHREYVGLSRRLASVGFDAKQC
jgi:hypothetical protein